MLCNRLGAGERVVTLLLQQRGCTGYQKVYPRRAREGRTTGDGEISSPS